MGRIVKAVNLDYAILFKPAVGRGLNGAHIPR